MLPCTRYKKDEITVDLTCCILFSKFIHSLDPVIILYIVCVWMISNMIMFCSGESIPINCVFYQWQRIINDYVQPELLGMTLLRYLHVSSVSILHSTETWTCMCESIEYDITRWDYWATTGGHQSNTRRNIQITENMSYQSS